MSVQAAVAFLNGDNDDEPDTTTVLHRPILPLSKLPSSTTTPNKSIFSKPPPHHWNKSTLATTTIKRTHCPTPRSVLDIHAEELTSLYQDVLDKLAKANETIAKLTTEVEIYACDSTKVRDYEIRVEYLAQKLEQVSEERDSMEQELLSYKTRHGDSLATPVSVCFEPNDLFGNDTQRKKSTPLPPSPPQEPENAITNDDEDNNNRLSPILQQQPSDDTYFDDLLDAYEETDGMQQEHVEELMARMQAEYDQGMKMAMESYVADLAQQRLENKTLQAMVEKQEELINKLEYQDSLTLGQQQQLPHNDENLLLHQQVELQQIELESKRELLTQLLNERNSNSKQQHRSASVRSSIDALAEIAKAPPKSPSSIRSLKHQQRDTGRSTPPPFAPPKTPLPPLPAATFQNDSSMSVNMGMTPTSISYSRSSTSSTSWSSDEQHQLQHLPPQHPLSTIMAPTSGPALPEKHSDMPPMVVNSTTTPAPSSSGSFWKGLKKKF